MLLHSDDDGALNQLGYYEQGKNETSAGVGLFYDASDGIHVHSILFFFSYSLPLSIVVFFLCIYTFYYKKKRNLIY
ncbi:unnamed protein product [Rotaria sordida]|uniref:Uncharacterized protein n=1 Tax=Rotaria sordida TaxID=392033 RepID=A0A815AUE2_9BILA|nr:unnamed protein product [Rotaria sordida]CAF1261414.1 unnamed protein product [Rotaria sordida]